MCSSNTSQQKYHTDPRHRSFAVLMLGMLPFIHYAAAICTAAHDTAIGTVASVQQLLSIWCIMLSIALPLLTVALQLICWEVSNWKATQKLTCWPVWMPLEDKATSTTNMCWTFDATMFLLHPLGAYHTAAPLHYATLYFDTLTLPLFLITPHTNWLLLFCYCH